MLEKKKGSIIITSSISGAVANRPQLQTCVSYIYRAGVICEKVN